MDGMDWNSLGEGQVSGLSSDAQDAELRADLTAALRGSAVEISARLERCYVEQYPHSRANQMDAAAIHEWTLSDIETLACAIEADDPSLRYFGTMVGDQLVDLHNAELTPFVNFLSTIHFEARVIAPVLYESLLGTPARASWSNVSSGSSRRSSFGTASATPSRSPSRALLLAAGTSWAPWSLLLPSRTRRPSAISAVPRRRMQLR